MKKIGIMLDANHLIEGIVSNKGRRGIYFVICNLISEFLKRENVILYFFINKNSDDKLKSFINKEWGEHNLIFYEYKPLILFSLHKKYKNNSFISFCLTKLIDFQKKKQVAYRNKFLAEHHCDVFFSPYNKIPGIFLNVDLKKFTVVHDLIPLVKKELFSRNQIETFQNLVNSFNENDYYFTVSEYTKMDLLKVVPNISPDRVFPSYISCSEENFFKTKQSDSVRQKYKIPLEKKYIFSLFAVEKRKNLERNLRAFLSFISDNNIDDVVYVVGGGFSSESLPSFFEEIDTSNIIFTGYIEDGDLSALYSEAEFFVFTSMYEGFGLPVLEAMRCGCPVIASNSSSLPEVVGDAGILIDWDSEEQHIKAYERYYFDKDFRNAAIKRGLSQSKKFSWKKTVDYMIEKMQENI